MRFGVELAVRTPVADLVESLRVYDKFGFDRVWVPDTPISLWEVWTTASLAATHTQRVRIGVGVTSPYHRSPAVMAHAAATLEPSNAANHGWGFGLSTWLVALHALLGLGMHHDAISGAAVSSGKPNTPA